MMMMTKRYIALSAVCCFFASALLAQLPAGFAEGEQNLLLQYAHARQWRNGPAITSAPDFAPRNMAEWEEIQALVVTWTTYPELLREIVRHARLETRVLIVSTSPTSVQNYLTAGNVPLDNVSFINAPANSVWIRDYGPNSVYANEVDSLYLVDWIYNRPRPQDDVVPQKIAEALGLQLYGTTQAPSDLVHTGGNYMSDGLGTGFSSNLVLEENAPGNSFGVSPKSAAEVDAIMADFLGLHTYVKMPTLPYDGIHHIDMHMKLLNEETLLVGQYPAGVADGPQIEANIQYVLNNFNSAFGTPYKLRRIQMPPDGNGLYPDDGWWADYRTYANMIFINKTVLVPTYETQYDTTALRLLREAMPGYKVVGLDCNDIIQASGAIHCITHSVGVNDPLWIVHQALPDQLAGSPDYPVTARIRHRSGIAGATLHFRTDTLLPYQSLPMSALGDDEWTANIPAQAAGTQVFYYIAAQANSGKSQVRPLPAPAGFFHFRVTGNTSSTAAPAGGGTAMLRLFPNPARAITCVPLRAAQAGEIRLDVLDMLGRPVLRVFAGQVPAGDSQQFFDAGGLHPGAYLLRLQDAQGGQAVQGFIVR